MSANTFLPPSPVIPPFLVITNITTTNPMVITVLTSNGYIAGQLVYLSVPPSYGMTQANQLTGEVLSKNGFDLTVSINATQFDQFVMPSVGKEQPATVAPAGSRNIYNISYVPFHSEGNFGN